MWASVIVAVVPIAAVIAAVITAVVAAIIIATTWIVILSISWRVKSLNLRSRQVSLFIRVQGFASY